MPMCGLFQPIGQVRLTNVATVRLKANNVRFEIACYKNKVLNWKSGVETDIQEVLQCPYIFTSISKGKLAKNEQLLKAFGTKDVDVICRQILDKGEIQVSKEERNQLLHETFKDVVTIISEVAINPKTGKPLSSTLVESTLKASAFSITLKEPAKKQALKALAHLQQLYPDDIARSQMRLKITCLYAQRPSVLVFLREHGSYVEHDGLSDCEQGAQSPATDSSSPKDMPRESMHQRDGSKSNTANLTVMGEKAVGNSDRIKENPVNPKAKKEELVITIRFLCCTKIYRDVDNFVSNVLNPPGSLQLVSLNVKDAGNRGLVPIYNETKALPSEPKETSQQGTQLTTQEEDAAILEGVQNITIKATEKDTEKPTVQAANKSAFNCKNCGMGFESSSEYRHHCKSEFHVINSKMVLKGLSPEEFQALDMCLKNTSLDT